MIGVGVVTIYSSFISEEKKKERMSKRITEILEMIKNERLPEHAKRLTLAVSCYDSNGDDVDIPLIRYIL
jgi:ubiquitin-activating enzyme E1